MRNVHVLTVSFVDYSSFQTLFCYVTQAGAPFLKVLSGIEPRTSGMLGKCSTIDLCPQLHFPILHFKKPCVGVFCPHLSMHHLHAVLTETRRGHCIFWN